jgi:hypothetical protein
MLCVPAARLVVVKVVIPPETVPEPILVAPSKNVIVPVADAATWAVKVTEVP